MVLPPTSFWPTNVHVLPVRVPVAVSACPRLLKPDHVYTFFAAFQPSTPSPAMRPVGVVDSSRHDTKKLPSIQWHVELPVAAPPWPIGPGWISACEVHSPTK